MWEQEHRTVGRERIMCFGTARRHKSYVRVLGQLKVNTKHFVTREYLNDRPQAEWIPDPGAENSNNTHVTSGTYYGATANGLSLYEAQLEARKSAGIRAIPASWYK